MKRKLLTLLTFAFVFASCSDDDGINPDSPINFRDDRFEEYLLANFDTNEDGKISYAEAKNITVIDCSAKNITSLEGIKHFTTLRELNCSGNKITSIDLSGLSSLKKLNCSINSNLTSIKFGKNTILEELVCNNCKINSLDLSPLTALSYLDCSGNISLSKLNVSKNVALLNLICNDNKLSALDLEKNYLLQNLDCSQNVLAELKLSTNIALQTLNCRSNNLKSLNVSSSLLINSIDCRSNSNLTELYVKAGTVSDEQILKDSQTTIYRITD